MIRVRCIACSAVLNVNARIAATSQECPSCGKPIKIPELSAGADRSDDSGGSEDAEFDPMDVLGGESPTASMPSQISAAPETSSTATPEQPRAEPATSDTATPDSETAAAAMNAMAAMRTRVPIPAASRVEQQALSAPTKRPVSEELREAFSSGEQFVAAVKHRKLYLILAASLLLALVVFAPRGCSDRIPVYPVSGRVLFPDGSPVRTGTIEFESEEHGTSSTGRIDEDGHFSLGTYEPADGAPAGSHNAIVTQMVISDGTFKHEKDHGLPVAYRYRRYDTSGLRFTVEPEDQNELEVLVEPEVEVNDPMEQ